MIVGAGVGRKAISKSVAHNREITGRTYVEAWEVEVLAEHLDPLEHRKPTVGDLKHGGTGAC
jgi:hypothetical protein